jgi:hypothetical protein
MHLEDILGYKVEFDEKYQKLLLELKESNEKI